MSSTCLLDKVVIFRPDLFRIFHVTVTQKRFDEEEFSLRIGNTARIEARSFENSLSVDKELQRRFLTEGRYFLAGYDTNLAYKYSNSGVFNTLQKMYIHRQNLDKVKAILISACLYENGLDYRFTELYRDLIEFVGDDYWWGLPCKHALPKIHGVYLDVDKNDRSSCDELIIERICNYLTRLIHKTDFVEIKPTTEPTELLEQMIVEDEQAELERQKEWEATRGQRIQARLEQSKQEARKKQLEIWRNLSKQELERLIWTHSDAVISEMYGITEKSIRERCSKLGIDKPNMAFWYSVADGRTAHPNGVKPEKFKQEKRVYGKTSVYKEALKDRINA